MAADVATLAAELAAHADAEARIAAALVELERHPGHLDARRGHEHRRYRGAVGGRERPLAALWEDFAAYRSALDDARTRPAERHRLLRGATVEVAGETLTLDALATRMVTTLREVTRWSRPATTRTGPSSPRWCRSPTGSARRWRRPAISTRKAPTPHGSRARWPTSSGRSSTTRWRSPTSPSRRCSRPLADALGPVTARCAELAAARDGWTAGIAELETALAAAAALHGEADRAGRRAQELVADADPPVPDPLTALRARLAALPRIPGWPARATAVQDLRVAVAETTVELRTAADVAVGLVERRGELRGRFDAYRAKAARLGVVERPDVLAAGDRVHDLLWTRPCDLAAATVAVVEYQRLVRDGG